MQAPPHRSRLVRWLSVFGLASLTFLAGAAVMFFQLPASSLLNKAFAGGRAWYQRWHDNLPVGGPNAPIVPGTIDRPDKTYDGFTLCLPAGHTRAILIDMRGNEVHRWQVPFSEVQPKPPELPAWAEDSTVSYFDAHLYPNGDLLTVSHGPGNPFYGYGLVKMDKDSNVLWTYPENCHHDVDVAEDGTIYAIRQKLLHEMPAGLDYIPTPCLVDELVVLSPQGEERKTIPLLEAFRDSPYAPLLSLLERARDEKLTAEDDYKRRDVLHTNSVKVLTRQLAPAFPLFRAGQLLISMRHLDTIAVLDPDKGSVVWAARGPWRAQHDPSFLDNGRLLLFDNLGSPRGSRVLEYDPRTQSFPWTYGDGGETFFSHERGMCQRLPNGNTLIVNSDAGEVLEVTADRERVWSCSCGPAVHGARRFSPDQLTFLKGGQRARP
jgi:hypothetical protein